MRKAFSLLLALLLMLSLGGQAFAAETAAPTQVVSCTEQGFSVLCDKEYVWNYSQRDGITIYTEYEGSIPYVLVFRSEDWIVDAADYIEEQFTPHMQKKYGGDLVAYAEYEHYNIGGRDLAAGLYTYRLQGYLIDMVRAYDVQDRQTVVFTAKYIRGQGAATMEALDQAVASYRPDAEYYSKTAKYPRWNAAITTTPGGDECWAFDGCAVTLPASWKGKVHVEVRENNIAFYQAQSFRLWQEKGYTGGLMFALAYSEKEDFRDLPSYDTLGRSGRGWYYLIYPTDLQAYADDSVATEEYLEMFSLRDFIRDSAYCF